MTPLRQRMIEDMQLKGYSEGTQKLYVNAVRQLCDHFNKSPGKITEEDLREYFLFGKNVKKWTRSTSTVALCGIKFFYENTIKRPWPTLIFIRPGREKKLPVILSRNEVHEFLNNIRLLRYRVCFSTIYSCGLRLSEGTSLKVENIDSDRGFINVRQSKGNKDREVPLPKRTLLLGRRDVEWQDTEYVLAMFADQRSTARRGYRNFVKQGIKAGRRPDLVGGGLIRGIGGWKAARALVRGGMRVKGDERILGDGAFVLNVLSKCDEQYERRYRIASKGVDLETLIDHVAKIFDLTPEELLAPGRYPTRVKARSLLFFWAVRELGMTATELAKATGMTQPAVSMSVKRGEQITMANNFNIEELL